MVSLVRSSLQMVSQPHPGPSDGYDALWHHGHQGRLLGLCNEDVASLRGEDCNTPDLGAKCFSQKGVHSQPGRVVRNIIHHDCRYLMRQLGVEMINHVYYKGNKCADLLANMDFNDCLDFHIFDIALD
ncbi:hypothetical protein RHMOL_Rhmol13G0293700 [Rhododendron molle]|uniref:Uncharacterized protein n=1 Tax=Rhododendron molle TaxID=49168 RepID=A0ACC0LCI9_RHOML|nr:hypothetical protein RHMOL_Rhmol13G0293700 [Rhododendron molle]